MTDDQELETRARARLVIDQIRVLLEPLSLYERAMVVHALALSETASTMTLCAETGELETGRFVLEQMITALQTVIACDGDPDRTERAVEAVLQMTSSGRIMAPIVLSQRERRGH